MPKLDRCYINKTVGLIMEETQDSTDTVLRSLEVLGGEFIVKEMEGYSDKKIKMGELIAKNIARIKILLGILAMAIKDTTGKVHVIAVKPEYLTLFSAIVRDTLIVGNFLNDDYEILPSQSVGFNPPNSFEDSRERLDKLLNTSQIGKIKGVVLSNRKDLEYLQYLNLYALGSFIEFKASQRYTDWLNLVMISVIECTDAFNKKCDTKWVN